MSTFNNETVYATVHMELDDGPVVYEQPAMDKKGYTCGVPPDIPKSKVSQLLLITFRRQQHGILRVSSVSSPATA